MAITPFILKSKSGQTITITQLITRVGRAPDNDVILKDEKVSRYHLTFYIKDGQLVVEDAGSHNGFLINNVKVSGAVYLNPKDKITFGGREFKLLPPGLNYDPDELPPRGTQNSVSAMTVDFSKKNASAGPRNNKPVIIAVAIILLVLGWLYLQDDKKPASKKRDEVVKALDPKDFLIPKESAKSITEIRSEAKFKEGMRDYNNGLYTRALQTFREAIAIDPNNELAVVYEERSQKNISKYVTRLYNEGLVTYNSTGQYRITRIKMLSILSMLGELIPGFGVQASRKISSEFEQNTRMDTQEKILLSIPCKSTMEPIICDNAKLLLRDVRMKLREEDILK